jgi:hypothetical protein
MERADVDAHTYGNIEEAVGAATSIAEALGHQLTDWVVGSPLGSLAVCQRCGHFLHVQLNAIALGGFVAQGAALQRQCSGSSGAAS